MLKLCFSSKRLSLPLLGLAMLFLGACKDDGGMAQVDFDRNAMLVHWYDDQLLPSFNAFNTGLQSMEQSAIAFEQDPSTSKLEQLRNDFREAYRLFQHVKFYAFGPSATYAFRTNLNTYPTNPTKIAELVKTGGFNGGSSSQLDAQGFPAIDYLLFSSDVDLLSSVSHRAFMKTNIDYILSLTNTVLNDWSSNSRRADFINANGTDVSSTLGKMVNALNQDYELIKNAKIGFPAGKKTFGNTYPEAVEAYYSGISTELAIENLKAIHNFYTGRNAFSDKQGISLLDNLLATKAEAEGALLANVIDDQFATALNTLESIPSTLSAAVDNHANEVGLAYSAIQLNIIYLKTDMPSALGVIITYQDNDGD